LTRPSSRALSTNWLGAIDGYEALGIDDLIVQFEPAERSPARLADALQLRNSRA
jgi:hypothetical protein